MIDFHVICDHFWNTILSHRTANHLRFLEKLLLHNFISYFRTCLYVFTIRLKYHLISAFYFLFLLTFDDHLVIDVVNLTQIIFDAKL